MQVMECFTGSGGRSRLGASRRPFGDGSCYRHSQPSPHNPYGVLAFDEFTDEAKSLRCLSYLTNRVPEYKLAMRLTILVNSGIISITKGTENNEY